MASMKCLGMCSGIVLAVALVLLGPVAVVTHMRAAREVARGWIEARSPDVQQAAKCRIRIHDFAKWILSHQELLADVVDRAEAAEASADRLEAELDRHMRILATAKPMLDKPQTHYEIGGKTYTHDQLRADVRARLQRCEAWTAQRGFHRRVAAQLRGTEREGRQNLIAAEEQKREIEVELEHLEIRLANAGLLQEVNALTSQFVHNPLAPQSELAPELAEFRKRVRAAERQADQVAVDARGGLLIDWEASGDAAPDLSAEIAQAIAARRAQK